MCMVGKMCKVVALFQDIDVVVVEEEPVSVVNVNWGKELFSLHFVNKKSTESRHSSVHIDDALWMNSSF